MKRNHSRRLAYSDLYVSQIPPLKGDGYILYVHGGPGFHSAYFEQALQELPPYQNFEWGWICYDQRACGRSPNGGSPITHDLNVEDLAALITWLQKQGVRIAAILGHSYGGWLGYHTLLKHPEIQLPLIVVGTTKDMRTAKNHSAVLDLLELRMDHPEVYKKVFKELGSLKGPLWNIQDKIRETATPLTRRPFFLWGNLETKAWYEALKQRVNLPENWSHTREISKSAEPYATEEINPTRCPRGLLWICGVHDLLMGYDQYYPGDPSPVLPFFNSGHYPQYEEPETFLAEVQKFLRTHSV